MSELTTIQRRKLNYNSLATDLVLFGEEDLDGVMKAHALDEFALAELLETNEALKVRIRQLRKQIEADPRAVIRMKASSMVESNLAHLSSLVRDGDTEGKDRINAMRLLSELADALPKADKTGPAVGMVLQLNLGSVEAARGRTDLPRPVNVIEAQP